MHACGNPWHDLPLWLGLAFLAVLPWWRALVALGSKSAHNLSVMFSYLNPKRWHSTEKTREERAEDYQG
jgi:hypothetical protein